MVYVRILKEKHDLFLVSCKLSCFEREKSYPLKDSLPRILYYLETPLLNVCNLCTHSAIFQQCLALIGQYNIKDPITSFIYIYNVEKAE